MKLPSIFISFFLSVTVVAASWMSCCAGLSAPSEMVTGPTSNYQVNPAPACHNDSAQDIASVSDVAQPIEGDQRCEGCEDCQFTVIIDSPSFFAALNMPVEITTAISADIGSLTLGIEYPSKDMTPTPSSNVSSVDGRFIETDLYLI